MSKIIELPEILANQIAPVKLLSDSKAVVKELVRIN